MQGLCHPINGPGTPPGQGFGNANAPLLGVAGTVSGQSMVVPVVTIRDAVRRSRGMDADTVNSLMGIRSNGNTMAETPMIFLKGDITDDGNVEDNGVAIEGSIHLPAELITIEASSRVEGHILGRSVMVRGEVIGDVSARECVAVMATGQVRGNIAAPRVLIQDGARIRGRIDMSVDEVRPDFSEGIDNAA